MHKMFALAEIKEVGDAGNGSFEAVVSVPSIDRDGEIIDAKAFEPLPDSVPVHAFHYFDEPIGRGVPAYDGDVLTLAGTFASTPRAQEIRTLVAEGVIGHMSVGFMGAARTEQDGVPHITRAELLEVSFVSVPSNRDAAVLAVKTAGRCPRCGGHADSKTPSADPEPDAAPEAASTALADAEAAKAAQALATARARALAALAL